MLLGGDSMMDAVDGKAARTPKNGFTSMVMYAINCITRTNCFMLVPVL